MDLAFVCGLVLIVVVFVLVGGIVFLLRGGK